MFSNSRPNGRLTKARLNGRLIKAEAAKHKTPRFEPWIANSHNPTQKVYQWQGRASSSEKRPKGRFSKGRPILSNANDHLISAGGHFMKAEGPFSRLPISSAPISFENKSSGRFLSRPGPMAVLSRQKQPNLSRGFGCLIIPRNQCISAEPSHFFNKMQFYQCQAQWQFYQSRSNQMARPLDFSNKLQFRYYPAQSTYQRPGKAIFSRSQPNGRCITWPLYQGRSS